jgi:MFS family permease
LRHFRCADEKEETVRSPEAFALFLAARVLAGFFCGALLYAGLALARAEPDEDGNRPKWGLFGWLLVGASLFMFLYPFGVFFPLVYLVTNWSRLPGSFIVIGELLPLAVIVVAAMVGYAWGRRVYREAYRAAEAGRADWPESGPLATA